MKTGLPPGTLMHIGEQKIAQVKITLIDYDEAQCEEKEVSNIEECLPFTDRPTVTWLNVDGLHQMEVIERIGSYLDLHPLLLEDLVNTGQRPKLEEYGDHLFVVLKMLTYDDATHAIQVEQVSLILGRHFVISFQEGVGDVFNAIRLRIKSGAGRLRKTGADYLAYSLVDAVVDNYFTILERLGDEVEELEEELVTDPRPETLQTIHMLKRQMILLRRSVWPLREVISVLERGESPLIGQSTEVYLRDVYDHTIQVIDTIETIRDVLSGMLDIYLSGVSNRMNEVMKVLTVFATIFIPLTFLTGVYGMNFAHMPELEWPWAYPVLWSVMLAIAGALLLYFRRRKWL